MSGHSLRRLSQLGPTLRYRSATRIPRGSPSDPVARLRCNLSDKRRQPGAHSPEYGSAPIALADPNRTRVDECPLRDRDRQHLRGGALCEGMVLYVDLLVDDLHGEGVRPAGVWVMAPGSGHDSGPSRSSPTLVASRRRVIPLAIESATILFTDMVGSTELSQRLSAEAADQVRREHFSILRQAIAEVGGTEVKNLGDGLMVVFGSASSALACAVAMQQGVERDNRDREHSVGLRAGISGGEVTREDDDYFGDPVVEAARLCATCESGQILATDIVRAMAGRRSRHECRPLGELNAQGAIRADPDRRGPVGAPRRGQRLRTRDRGAVAAAPGPAAHGWCDRPRT